MYKIISIQQTIKIATMNDSVIRGLKKELKQIEKKAAGCFSLFNNKEQAQQAMATIPRGFWHPNKEVHYLSFSIFPRVMEATIRTYLGGKTIVQDVKNPIQIGLIGGGLGYEAAGLKRVFLNSVITSIDNSIQYKFFEFAKLLPRAKAPEVKEFFPDQFIWDDATKASAYGKKNYDMFAIYHPQVIFKSFEDLQNNTFTPNSVFRDIFKESVNHLKENGLVLVTCFTKDEQDVSKSFLEDAGYQVLSHKRNEYRIPNPIGLFFEKEYKLDPEQAPNWYHFVLTAKKTPLLEKASDPSLPSSSSSSSSSLQLDIVTWMPLVLLSLTAMSYLYFIATFNPTPFLLGIE